MEPFRTHTGLAAPLDRVNVDTDQICPAVFLKRIEKTGFGPTLFHSWRFLPDGTPDPSFELNAPQYAGASVLVTGRNFGSGSSREHAVWALMDYGFRAIITTRLADIFHKNCFENGLAPVFVSEDVVGQIMTRAQELAGYQVTVDLETCRVTDSQGLNAPFRVHADPETHEFRRHTLLNGLDEIGLTLQHEDKISAYEERAAAAR